MANLDAIVQEILDNYLLEDRMEYDVHQLMDTYDLTEGEGCALANAIGTIAKYDVHAMLAKLAVANPLKVKHSLIGYIAESIHQEFDGWRPTEAVVVRKVLQGLVWIINDIEIPNVPYGAFGVDFDPTK